MPKGSDAMELQAWRRKRFLPGLTTAEPFLKTHYQVERVFI
jgi:hypothetical protein